MSGEINVISRTQQIIVDPFSSSVSIINAGPPGVTYGAPGPSTIGIEANKPLTPGYPMRYFATDTKRDWLYDGTGWIVMGEPPTAYTPTMTNTTLGTGGTNAGIYHRSDGWCDFFLQITLGTGGVLTGQPLYGLPFAAAHIPRYQLAVVLHWAGTNTLRGLNSEVNTGANAVYPLATWGDTPNGREAALNVSATHPFTWAVSCYTQISGRYRMNNRYS